MSDVHGHLPEPKGGAISDDVSGITDALGLVLMALVANGIVDPEKFAAAFLHAGRSARHGPRAKRFLEDCARTIRVTAAEIKAQDDEPDGRDPTGSGAVG